MTTTTTRTSGARRGRTRGGVGAFFVFILFFGLLVLPMPSISSTVGVVDEIDGRGGATPKRRLGKLGGENDLSSSSSASARAPSSFEKHPTTDIVDQVSDGTIRLRITSEQPPKRLRLSPNTDLASKFQQTSTLGHPSRDEMSVSSLGGRTVTYLTNLLEETRIQQIPSNEQIPSNVPCIQYPTAFVTSTVRL